MYLSDSLPLVNPRGAVTAVLSTVANTSDDLVSAVFHQPARAGWLLSLILASISLPGCSGRHGTNPRPLAPPDALNSFRLSSSELRVELFAAEPDVISPVEIAFDEDGRAYVAEMLDYPYDPEPGKAPLSRIRLLEDNDGNGKADRSTIFADHLLQVTGILPWKGGLIVTSAPDILFLKDTDGDDRADVRRVLLTGFSTKVVPDHRMTNPRLGID